ncbi:transposase IS66 family protein [Burkholderia pseudomallei]|uniref:IS66 family transposase n=1 Tax=Burkholderia pseudomallei TaxID=28450 RepID=UPI00050F848D|nr:transposase [Burkholderia pseudomallei]KGC96272.1 transposase IS66 family protein [Burkholderia pseudomallei]
MPARSRVIPKALSIEEALACFVVSKFVESLPLYRIAAPPKRFGGDISLNRLVASVVRMGDAQRPVIGLMRDH